MQQNSIQADTTGQHDTILTNIPFSQKLDVGNLVIAGSSPSNADEACVLKCFDSLKDGGRMALVVPEGLLVNKNSENLLSLLAERSRIRLIVRLPRGCFRPYTDAKTAIIYLTDKNMAQTNWFYLVNVHNDGFDQKRRPVHGEYNDLDSALFLLFKRRGGSQPAAIHCRAS